jgi:hypothetical protein
MSKNSLREETNCLNCGYCIKKCYCLNLLSERQHDAQLEQHRIESLAITEKKKQLE